jgi:hypothetical protein
MTIYDVCAEMADDKGVLNFVGYLYDPEYPREIAAIRLIFERGDWLAVAEPDDDTVELTRTTDDELAKWRVADASTVFPWAAVLHKRIAWVWVLENQQGYTDAVQLEFAGPVNGGEVTIQVLAVNAQLRVRAVLPVETPLLPN